MKKLATTFLCALVLASFPAEAQPEVQPGDRIDVDSTQYYEWMDQRESLWVAEMEKFAAHPNLRATELFRSAREQMATIDQVDQTGENLDAVMREVFELESELEALATLAERKRTLVAQEGERR